MRLVLLIIAILYFAIPAFSARDSSNSGSNWTDCYTYINDKSIFDKCINAKTQEASGNKKTKDEEIIDAIRIASKHCPKVATKDACSPHAFKCANAISSCGKLKDDILAIVSTDKLTKVPDKEIETEDDVKYVELGPCKDFTNSQLSAYFSKQLEGLNKDIPEHKKEVNRVEEKINEVRTAGLEKEMSLSEKIQGNAIKAKELASSLQAALNEAPLALQAKIDDLKAQFEIQNTVIEDIKNAVADLDKELQDKTDEIEQACVDEAEKTVKEIREEAKKRRALGQNRLSVNSALRSASTGGATGEDNISFREYFSECLEKRKVKDLKAKAIRENISKKKKLQNDLNRALIQAAKIQAEIKREVDKTNIATKNLAQKINSQIGALSQQNQQLGDQLNKLSALNGLQLQQLQATLNEEKMALAVDSFEKDGIKKAAGILGTPTKLTTDEKKEVEKQEEIETKLSGLANFGATTGPEDSDNKEIRSFFGVDQADCSQGVSSSTNSKRSRAQ